MTELRYRRLPLFALGLWIVGGAVSLALPPRGLARAAVVQVVWVALAALAAAAGFARARREPQAAAGWRLVGVALALLAAAGGSVIVEALLAGAVLPFPRPGDWLQIAALVALGFAFLLWPLSSPSVTVRLRTFVDAALFAVACFACTWGLLVWPMRTAGVPAEVWGIVVAQFGVATVLLAIAVYLGLGRRGRFRGPIGWVTGALGLATAATVSILVAGAGGTYYLGHPFDLGASLAAVVFVQAAVSAAPIHGTARPDRQSPDPLLFGGWVTYSSVAVAFAVGMWAMIFERRDDPVLLMHGFAVVLLLVVRQLLAIRDIRTLTNTLEAKVEERTRALEASQAALQRTARLEALGRLAGGVAHDINNLLMGIVGYAELLEISLGAQHPQRDDLVQIRRAVERGARLTRQLLAFARKQPGRPTVLDPFAMVTDLERLLHRLIGSDVRLQVLRTGGDGCVRIDPGQLEQVLVNLAVNAREAMPKGGSLTIEVADVDISPAEAAQVPDARAGGFARLRVRDTGVGMTREVLGRIFEPFFTTKDETKGTGLGLATCYGIVQQNGGFITVESAPGFGTCFDVFLPRTDERPEWTAAADAPRDERRGTETILLAEDDPQVRGVMTAALQAQGYEVIVANDGAEAVAAAQRHAGPIHLFLTDQTMPGLTGLDAARVIAGARPGLRVLVVSGYLADRVAPGDETGLAVDSLPKPVSPLELTRKVRALLDQPG